MLHADFLVLLLCRSAISSLNFVVVLLWKIVTGHSRLTWRFCEGIPLLVWWWIVRLNETNDIIEKWPGWYNLNSPFKTCCCLLLRPTVSAFAHGCFLQVQFGSFLSSGSVINLYFQLVVSCEKLLKNMVIGWNCLHWFFSAAGLVMLSWIKMDQSLGCIGLVLDSWTSSYNSCKLN